MKPSSRSTYALKALVCLAAPQGGPMRVADIAREEGIPTGFLEQILLRLRSGGLVESRRGRGGGYVLARAPERISLAAVLRLTGDGGVFAPPAEAPGTDPSGQALAEVWSETASLLRERLEARTVADLRERAAALRAGTPDYVI